MPRHLSPLVGVVLVSLALTASAQDEEVHPAFTARDTNLDRLLEEAAQHERRGAYDEAVATYLRVEEALRKGRAKDPSGRPTTEVGPGIDRGVGLYLRDRIRALPADALARYRQSIDPRAREELEVAVASRIPEQIETVIARYPLSTVTESALGELADLAMERGELGRAIRAYRRIEAGAEEDRARQVALLRAYAALARRDAPEARDALVAFVKHGGNAKRVRQFGARKVTLQELVGQLGEARVTIKRQPGFDPGDLVRKVPLAKPELPEQLARKLPTPTAHQQGVLIPGTGMLLVADTKTLQAVPVNAPRGARGWTYSLLDAESEPSRLEVAAPLPAIGPGTVFATLHRNRPAQIEVTQEDGEDEETIVVHRRKDWRVVCLDAKSGNLLWDAGARESFETISRDAEWVSAPLYFEGAVYVTVIERESDLRASLVRLDAANGEAVFQTFIASRSAYDHLGLGSPPPAPTASPLGHVLVATSLGTAASIEPTQGDVVWIARYPVVPESSQPTIVLEKRRFRVSTPLGERSPVIVAPVDSVDVVALDAATGRRLWRAPRSDARLCVAAPNGNVLLLGRRLVARDRKTGRVVFAGDDFGEPVIGAAAVLGKELVAATATALVRVSLESGKLLARLRFEDPVLEVGSAVSLGKGLLGTVGCGRLNIFSSLELRLAEIEDRYGRDPRRRVLQGRLRARRGEVYQALTLLQKALRSGLDQTSRFDAQREAIDLLVREAQVRFARGDITGFTARASRVVYFLGALGVRPGKEPTKDAELDLLTIAAPALRRYADLHAGSNDPKAWPKAADAYQRLLWTPPGTLVALAQGTEVDARTYARARVKELVASRGIAAYAPFEDAAKAAHDMAKASKSKIDYRRVIEHYPASTVAPDARWELAGAFEADGLRSEATDELRWFLRDHPADDRVANALARLILLNQRLQRLADARRCVDELKAMEPEPSVRIDPTKPAAPARVWVRKHAEVLVGSRSPAALRLAAATRGLDAPLARVFRSTTELSQDGAELLRVESPDGTGSLFFLRRGTLLEVRRVPDGELQRIVSGLPPITARTRPSVAGGNVVVAHPARIEAYALKAKLRAGPVWTFDVTTGPAAERVGPNAVHAVRASTNTVYVLTGTNEVIALSVADGTQRWRRPLPFKASGGLIEASDQVMAYSMSPGKVIALGRADGNATWTYDPAAGQPGKRIRIASPTWLGEHSLIVVEDGQRLVALDVTKGAPRWRVAGDGAWVLELLTSRDGALAVTRTHGGGGSGLRVYDAVAGKELWRDNGGGAARPGAPAMPAAKSSLSRLALGENSLYSFRTTAGRDELWAQDLRLGQRAWVWQLPPGSRATQAIETPSAVLVPRNGVIGQRAALIVLARGTGKKVEHHGVPGRRLVGIGAHAAEGVAGRLHRSRGRQLRGSGPGRPLTRDADPGARAGEEPDRRRPARSSGPATGATRAPRGGPSRCFRRACSPRGCAPLPLIACSSA